MAMIRSGLKKLFHRRDRFDNWDQLISSNTVPRDGDEEDTVSVSSHSTNSTIDDNIGTGRLVDKYLYQKGGRKLERLIFYVRIKTTKPDPSQICRYFESLYWRNQFSGREKTLQQCAYLIGLYENGSTNLSGLKNLVQQTR